MYARIFVGRQRRADHHVLGADVAVLHVALRRIEDVHQVVDRMDALPGRGRGRPRHRRTPVVAGGADRRGPVAHVGDRAFVVGEHHVLFVVLIHAERVVNFVHVAGHRHFVELFREAHRLEIGRRPDVGDARLAVRRRDDRSQMRVKRRADDGGRVFDDRTEMKVIFASRHLPSYSYCGLGDIRNFIW